MVVGSYNSCVPYCRPRYTPFTHLSFAYIASPTVPSSDTTAPDDGGEGGEEEGGPGNEAPITGHTLAVVIGE